MAAEDNLMAFYKLETDGSDEQTGGHDTSPVNPTIAHTTGGGGQLGEAADFERSIGQQHYILTGGHADFDGGDFDFSFLAWVNRESTSGSMYVWNHGFTSNPAWGMSVVTSKFRIWIYQSGERRASGTVSISNGTWYMWAGGFSSSGNIGWGRENDGTPITVSITGVPSTGNGEDVIIGARDNTTPDQGWDGQIDAAGKWDRDIRTDTDTGGPIWNSGAGWEFTAGGGGLSIPIAMAHYKKMRASFHRHVMRKESTASYGASDHSDGFRFNGQLYLPHFNPKLSRYRLNKPEARRQLVQLRRTS